VELFCRVLLIFYRASACNAVERDIVLPTMSLSVCQLVSLSNAGTVSKRMDVPFS